MGNTPAGKRIEELSLPDSLIPLLTIKGRSQNPSICRNDLLLEKGDKMVILDLGGGAGYLEGIGFTDPKEISV